MSMTKTNQIKADYFRYYGKVPRQLSFLNFLYKAFRNHCFGYMFFFRLASSGNFFARVIHRHLSLKYGIQIPLGTDIGEGFYIGHGVGIIINSTAKIGKNCNISQFTTIGSNKGQAATIGDNVYIGPGVSIVENVLIGNAATIGAGSVVVKNVPENATVAGNPARILNFNNPARFIKNLWGGRMNSIIKLRALVIA